jgi:hypothetical protein
MAEIWGAVIAGAAALGGGYMASQGAKKAAGKAAEGSDAAIGEQRRQFDTIRADTADYRAIGSQALNSLGSIYGYKPASSYFPPSLPIGATPYQGQPIRDDGFFNTGGGAALNPWTVTSQLGDAGKILDPLGGMFGNLFGNKHGDEKRNLKAFLAENQVYDLGNGKLALADGTQFPESKLQEIAGHWYGATYAPDGNQEQWQQSYNKLISPYKPAQGANVGQAGTGLTSEGVPQGFPGGSGSQNSLAAPDYSAFFQSPDYNFRRTEGQRDIGNSFAARGGAFSGNALRALTEFNSNLAAGEFGNYFNRQAALAGIGQTATNTSANAGMQTAANVGNALMNSGNARASGVAGQYNALGAGLSGAGQAFGYWNANRGMSPNSYGNQMWRYGPPGSYA